MGKLGYCFQVETSGSRAAPRNDENDFLDQATDELATVDQIRVLQNQIDDLKSADQTVYVSSPAACEPKAKPTYPDFKVTGFFQLDSAYFDHAN